MIEEITYRTSVGIGGFFATIGLQNINYVISILVGVATLTFMVLSIIKIVRDLKK